MNQRILPTILILVACVASAAALEVSITGPDKVDAGNSVFLQAEGADGLNVAWKILPVEAAGNFVPLPIFQGMTPDGKPIIKHCAFFASSKPGTYHVILAAADSGQVALAVHTITNGKVQPDPTPDPDPDPDPTPDPEPDPDPFPVPGKRLILLIREPGEANLVVAQVSATLQRYATEKGHEWRAEYTNLVNKDKQVPSWFKVYTDRIKAKGVPYPALVVGAFGDKGVSNVSVIPLPPTPKEAVDFVKSHGG